MKTTWTEQIVAIKDIKEYERNPRRIKDEHYKKLVKSLKEDGYHNRLRLDADFTIIGGHQRKRALLEAGFKLETKIPVLVSPKKLTEEEFRRHNVQDNLPYGEYDWDMLTADNDLHELIEWGMPEEWLPDIEEAHDIENKEEPKEPKICPNCGEPINE